MWVAAGTIAPLAGLGGDHTAVPMAALMIACIAASMIGLHLLARPGSGTSRSTTDGTSSLEDPRWRRR
jgi:DHA1 family bicyclomycin/chloramphenicol resistance-like MFS transporter